MSQYAWFGNLTTQIKNAFSPSKTTTTSSPAPKPAPTTTTTFKTIDPVSRSGYPPYQYATAPARAQLTPPSPYTWDFGFDTSAPSGGTTKAPTKASTGVTSSGGGSSPYYGGGGDFGGMVSIPPPPMPQFHAKLPTFTPPLIRREWNQNDPATTSPGAPPPAAYVRDKQRYAKLIGEEV